MKHIDFLNKFSVMMTISLLGVALSLLLMPQSVTADSLESCLSGCNTGSCGLSCSYEYQSCTSAINCGTMYEFAGRCLENCLCVTSVWYGSSISNASCKAALPPYPPDIYSCVCEYNGGECQQIDPLTPYLISLDFGLAPCEGGEPGGPTTPNFAVDVIQLNRTIEQGQSTTYDIAITPSNNYTGTVNLTSANCPSSATCTLSPNSVSIISSSAVASTLTITNTSGVTPQTYTLTVTGTDGTLTHSDTTQLIVTESKLANCDNTWRKIPSISAGGWPTVGIFIPLSSASSRKNSIGVIIPSAVGNWPTASYQNCDFNQGTGPNNPCMWTGSWQSLGTPWVNAYGSTANLFTSLLSNNWHVYILTGGTEGSIPKHIIPAVSGWDDIFGESLNWNSPHTTTDSSGRTWNIDYQSGISSYKCSSIKARLAINPVSFTFSGISGGATPSSQPLTITNTGPAASILNWTGSTNQGWCHISKSSGTLSSSASENINVSVDAPSNVGTFNCAITISDTNAENSPQTATVTYTVNSIPNPTNLSASCPAPGTSANFSWTLPTGYNDYNIRIYNVISVWPADGCLNPSVICNTGIGNGFSFTSTPGITYGWWVETRDAWGNPSSGTPGQNFTCTAVPANQAPVAVATISKNGVTYTDSITVTQGVATPIYLSASGSSDPNGWTDAVNGVSSGGKCEWNYDLEQGASPVYEKIVNNPATIVACSSFSGNGSSKTFNDAPGTYTYSVLRITDKPGLQSNIDTVQVIVQGKPDLITQNLAYSGILTPGSAINFSGNVKNNGGSSAAASNARFCIDNASCLTTTTGRVGTDRAVAALAAGATSAVINPSTTWSATAGNHTVYFCADVTGLISESNEANNCANQTFTVQATPPQCSDGIDNDGDGKIDSADPSCHTDNNPDNPGSYDPGLNNEFPLNYILLISKSGTGFGTITSTPMGINCGSDCTENYTSGTSVTLAASAAVGSTFAGWSGACSGIGSCVLTMNAAKNVTATFNLSAPQPDFTLNSSNAIFATIIQGSPTVSNNTTVTVIPANGFNSNVNLSVQSVNPALPGATYNFSFPVLSSSKYSSGSTFNINVPGNTPAGTYTITIRGADGGLIRTLSVNLNIEVLSPSWQEF